MGIQGLAHYINNSYKEWRDVSLTGCPLVLDGNALPFNLSKKAKLDWEYGGAYPALKEAMENFFDTLIAQNIQPIYVVFDGIDPKEQKFETILKRKQSYLDIIRKSVNGEHVPDHQRLNILPPLVTETFRNVVQDYKTRGVIKICSADGEADDIAVTLANKFECFLVGEDSDFFIFPLQVGYIPLSRLTWERQGGPVKGSAFKRDAFAASLGIRPDFVVAIPAIVGNDVLPNLVEETSLKFTIRDNPRYRGKDTVKAIDFIKYRCNSMEKMERSLLKCENGRKVLEAFQINFRKAREIYEDTPPFNEEEFRMSTSYQTKDGHEIPGWLIEQYRDFYFSKNLLEVLVKGTHQLRIIPDDFQKPSAKLFSQNIRKEIYGIMQHQVGVKEIVRQGYTLGQNIVSPTRSTMNIHTMNSQSKEDRVSKMCTVLLCNPKTFSSIDEDWYLAVASICFWVKNASIRTDDIRLKALILCFVECYQGMKYDFKPAFDLSTFHLYAQWQCTYNDAVLLNQVLMLPLPYLSPASIFDGRLVTYYSQQRDFRSILAGSSVSGHELYEKILLIVEQNM